MKGIKSLFPKIGKLSYVIYFIAFIVAIGYLVKNEYMAFASLFVLSAISYYFIKKCTYSLLIGILGSLIVVNFRARGREGFTGKDLMSKYTYTTKTYDVPITRESVNISNNSATYTFIYDTSGIIGTDCIYLDTAETIGVNKCYFTFDASNIENIFKNNITDIDNFEITVTNTVVNITFSGSNNITIRSQLTIPITTYTPTNINTNTNTPKT